MIPARISLVTYNLWRTERWPERRPALELFLERYQPDVLCVQELTTATAEVLNAVLSRHEHVHDSFAGWTTEGNIWWNKDLFSLVTIGAEEFGIEAYPDRRLFWVRLKVIDPQTTFFVGNIHLSDAALPAELDEGRNTRVAEIKSIISSLGQLVQEGEPAFLLGDFNDALAPLTHLYGAGYESPWAKLAQLPPPTMPANPDRLLGYGFSTNFVWDWIVANRAARPLAVSSPHVQAGDIPPSDHWPIAAVYELSDHREGA
jgi:endonuclease/exonuclease/phosphatase family metal-dependent hydrolase